MNRLRFISPGTLTLLLTFIAGLWLVVSPFAMNAQATGVGWNTGTINNVAVGGILMGVSLVGICVTLALGLRDLMRATSRPSEQTPAESAA